MTHSTAQWAALVALSALAGAPRAAETSIEEILVPGHAGSSLRDTTLSADRHSRGAPDSAQLMAQFPGAAYNDNGPLSGQTQYRGLFGPRMNVRIDGMPIHSGGPNWMDPPLHYIPSVLLESLTLTRGIAPVSEGAGIGANVHATAVQSAFTDSSAFDAQGLVSVSGQSAANSIGAGAMLGAANNTQRFHVLGSTERGDDRDFAGGTIAATEYERDFAGIGYGAKLGAQTISLDYRRSETGDAGNPVLPLDIAFLDTDLFNLKHEGTLGGFSLNTRLSYMAVDHRMSNYHLREAPDFSALPLPPFQGSDRRDVNADSKGLSYGASLAHDWAGGQLSVGMDGDRGENNAQVHDPDAPPFYVTNFNDATNNTLGLFSEWQGAISANAQLELGLRYERVVTDADAVDAQPANLPMADMAGTPPFAVRQLRDRFNSAERERTDHNIDWVAQLAVSASDTLTLELGLARKTRSPSYLERYAWIPLEVNAGLGDGNNYVGNIDLEPEVSHQLELGLNWRNGHAYFTPRVFYRRVDDFIQGTPSEDKFTRAVSGNANGDPNPLQFTNVDAELYGVDAMAGLRLGTHWRVDGSIGYTRGKRRDIKDDLYRIAPLNARASLILEGGDWSAALEGVAYSSQTHISHTITGNSAVGSQDDIPGYAIVNLNGQYAFSGTGVTLSASVDNLFDKDYIDPLSGFNRVSGSDIPVGERLHGSGRHIYLSARYRW